MARGYLSGASREDFLAGFLRECVKSRRESLPERKIKLGSTEKELQAAYQKLNTLVELNSDGIMVVDRQGVILFLNPAARDLFDRREEELLGEQFGHPLSSDSSTEIEILAGSGGLRVAELRVRETEWEGQPALLVTLRDITDRKQAERELQEREEELEAIYNNAPLVMLLVDRERKVRKANSYTGEFLGEPLEEMQGRRGGDILHCVHALDDPRGCGYGSDCSNCVVRNTVLETFETGKSFNQVEAGLSLRRPEGVRELTFLVSTSLLLHKEEQLVLVAIMDITQRKEAEENLRYMSYYDSLTGVYNRNFFETEMSRFSDGRYTPLGIIVCDVDGLKFINDSLGHQSGDKLLKNTADILRNTFRASDIIARLGGDEFAVLVPQADQDIAERLAQRLRDSVEGYNNQDIGIPLSLSVGFTVSGQGPVDMQDLFREADNRMYREKVRRKGSGHNAAVQALIQALEARDFTTEGHSERLQDLVYSLARSAGMAEDDTNDLFLLAQFHDLGKVGIPDRILFKPGPLTEEEWLEMRQHSEIGRRIAQAVPDLEPIADWILKHHERWDGQGYPLGLQGEEIPLPCRILAIVDAFDAMISERPYRKAMSCEDAITELLRCAGTQFDPELVEKFIQVLQQHDSG